MARGRNSVVIGVRVPDAVYARVRVLAGKEGWCVNDWMRSVVMRAAGMLPDGSVRSHHKRRSGGSGDKVVNTRK
jgi:hypothetical protein